MYKIWLLKLILPIRYGRTVSGLLLLSCLLPLFYIGPDVTGGHSTAALFFSLIIAYIIPVFSFITSKAQEALLSLRPILQLDDTRFAYFQARLDSATLPMTLLSLLSGAVAGCVHTVFIKGSATAAIQDVMGSFSELLSFCGTLMVWIVMTTVIVMLIHQAILFGRLGGRHTRLCLFDTRALRPFARVSISSSLAVIGALALFPLINLEGGLNLMESVPGAVAILGPLVVMFVIPVWPLHRRLLALKETELAGLHEKIDVTLAGSNGVDLAADSIDKLLPLLNYRREVTQISTWPFDLGNITTLAFYLIIPPLTWAGAALIENLVDYLL